MEKQMLKKTIGLALLLTLAVLGGTKIARNYYWDITQNKLNTLSESSKNLISSIDQPINIQVYSPNIEILNTCEAILLPYKKQSPLVSIELHEALIDPQTSSKLKLYSNNNIVVSYKNHQRGIDVNLVKLTEQQISNLIQQVVNNTNHWLVFLSGHKEEDPLDPSPSGLSSFAELFKSQGMHIAQLNLAQQQSIPNNTNTLIVANPQLDLLPLEKALLHNYLQKGGKLLWFTEPDSNVKAFIQEEFGIKLTAGVAIDPHSTQLGSPHPALKIMVSHLDHPINNELKTATILPWSGHLDISKLNNDWNPEIFIATNERTWTYAGEATQDINQMATNKEASGPLNIGIALSRANGSNQQRSMIIADTAFISNKYLPLYANAQLADNLVSWVQNNSNHYVFAPNPARDLNYQPDNFDRFMFRYGFTILLPLMLIGIGLLAEPRI